MLAKMALTAARNTLQNRDLLADTPTWLFKSMGTGVAIVPYNQRMKPLD